MEWLGNLRGYSKIDQFALSSSKVSIHLKASKKQKNKEASKPEIMMGGLTSIIILVGSKSGSLDPCLLSVTRFTPEPHEILLAASGISKKKRKRVKSILKDCTNWTIVNSSDGKNFAKTCNEAIRTSSGRYVVVLSDDTEVTEGWLSGMLECARHITHAGVIGPLCNVATGPQKALASECVGKKSVNRFAEEIRKRQRFLRIPCRSVRRGCMLFSRHLYDKIGGFDEASSGGGEERDFCLRAALEGKSNCIAGDVYVHQPNAASWVPVSSYFYRKRQGMAATKPFITLDFIEKGRDAYLKGLFDEAIEHLLAAIKHSPDNPVPYFELADMLLRLSRFKDVAQVISEIPTVGDNIEKTTFKGYAALGLNFMEDATRYSKQALSLNNRFSPALDLAGVLSLKAEKPDKAKEFYQKAIKADPGYGLPYTHLGKILRASSPDTAMPYLEKGFILLSTHPETLSHYYDAIVESGEFNRAITAFEAALQACPLNKTLRYRLIDLLIRLGRFERAMHEIEESIVLYGIDEGMLPAALSIRERVGPRRIPGENVRKATTVSLCMIVKNESRYLAKCLYSVAPVVDEMIVVDTGSEDQTKEIATVFGAGLYEYSWPDDFSEARNFSLGKALGDWIFVLDADEVLSSVDHSAFRKLVQKKPSTAYAFETRNYTLLSNTVGCVPNDGRYEGEEEGIGWTPSTKVRLFPNRPNVYFQYPVHEKVEPSLEACGISTRGSKIPIHHYGKLDTQKTAEKTLSYYHLGKAKLSEMANDIGAIRELAVQAGELEKYEDSVFLWEKVAQLNPDFPESFINMSSAHWQLGRFEQARICSERALELAPAMKEAHYNHAVSLLFLGEGEAASEILQRVLQKNPEYLPARFMLATTYCCLNQKEKAKNDFDELTKTQIGMGLNVAIKDIINRFLSAGQTTNAQKIVETAMEMPNLDPTLLNLLNNSPL